MPTDLSLKTLAAVLSLLFAISLFSTNSAMADRQASQRPDIAENIIMLYYKDLSLVSDFYEQTLGLSKTFDDEWVKIYQITPTSFVGIVQENKGGYHQAQNRNAVMLSLVTTDVDGWYEQVIANPKIQVIKKIYNNPNAPIRAFLVADPGGYSIEFFQWVSK